MNTLKSSKTAFLKVAGAVILCLFLLYICTLIGIAKIPFTEANRILWQGLAARLGVTGGAVGGANVGVMSSGTASGVAGAAAGAGVSGIAGSVSGMTDTALQAIILKVRLPRVLLSFLVGAALAVCGAAFQGIFRNPMADPYLLGVSSGAGLGATLGILLHFSAGVTVTALSRYVGIGATALLAFAGALGTLILVGILARYAGQGTMTALLLAGLAVGQTVGAIISLLMIFHADNMKQVIFWNMGSFNGADIREALVLFLFFVPCMGVLLVMARSLDVLLLGAETALQLGIDVTRVRRLVLIAASLLTAAAVAVSGIIGFVGLMVPHAARRLVGPKHARLFPMSLVLGGTFLTVCDTLARSVSAQEIPVGIVTALCGGPFFVYLLIRRSKAKGGAIS